MTAQTSITNDVQTLRSMLRELAQARAEVDRLHAEFTALQDEFNSRPEVKAVSTALHEAGSRTSAIEAKVRETAEAAFDGENKKPVPGLGIQERKVWVYDADAALTWAESHAPALIERRLNVKSYEKILAARTENQAVAAAFADMPGDLELKVTAAIARDLSEYLESEEVTA